MRLDKYPREFHRLMAQSALTKPGGEPFLLCSPRHHLSSDQPLALSGGRESEQHRVRSARATSPYEHSSRRRDVERNLSLFATVLVCVATLGEGQAFELLTSGSAIQSFLGFGITSRALSASSKVLKKWPAPHTRSTVLFQRSDHM